MWSVLLSGHNFKRSENLICEHHDYPSLSSCWRVKQQVCIRLSQKAPSFELPEVNLIMINKESW